MGVLVLAVLAAVIFAFGSVLQQRGARSSSRMLLPGRRRKGLRLATLLAGSPVWLFGGLLALVGFGFHAAALHAGSLAIVQPVQTLTLPASLLLASARAHHIAPADWAGIAALCGGVAVFLVVAAPHDGPLRNRAVLLLATVVTFGVIALLAVAGARADPGARGLLMGSAAAIGFALTAALTKAATTDLAEHGLAGLFMNFPFYLLVLAAVAGVGLEQAAFADAPLASVMLPVTLLNPIVATALGLVAWHEHLSSGAVAVLVAVLVGLAAATVGVSVLSRSTLLQPEPVRVE